MAARPRPHRLALSDHWRPGRQEAGAVCGVALYPEPDQGKQVIAVSDIYREVRCPECDKLLFKARLFGFSITFAVDIKCPRCGIIIVWPVAVAEAKEEGA